MKYSILFVPLALALIGAGYANPSSSLAEIPAPHQMPPSQIRFTGQTLPTEMPPEPTGTITVEIAIDAAINRHPTLVATWYAIKAREGAALQAGLRPNPTLFGEIEEFGGSGAFSGTSAMSSRIGISQEFSMGGKIGKGVREAEVSAHIAELEHQAQIMEIKARVELRFLAVFTRQEQLRLQSEQTDLIQKTHDVVGKRVKTGDTSPLDLARSQIELASAKIELQQTRMALEAARHLLAQSWGSVEPLFATVSAQYQSNPMITEQDLQQALERSPAWRLLDAQCTLAAASLDLAEAHRIHNIEVEAGVQRFNESDDHAFFLGISVPLPLSDKNQGGIAEARATKLQAQAEKEAGFLVLRGELQQAWRSLTATRQAVQSLETEVLPAAHSAYESSSKAYMAGEVDILSLLDAQRIWVETRKTRLDLLHEQENSRIELHRLVGEGASAAVAMSPNNTRNS